MSVGTYKVTAYLEYEIEASNDEEAILRIGECVISDMKINTDLRDIAEVNAEKISDTIMED